MYMRVLPAVSLCSMCIQFLHRLEEGVRFTGTGVIIGGVLPCGSCKWNLGPLGEQTAFLTSGLSLQPSNTIFYFCVFSSVFKVSLQFISIVLDLCMVHCRIFVLYNGVKVTCILQFCNLVLLKPSLCAV